MSRPLVTVCIPVFNMAPYVRPAIESVLAQEFTDWVILVADNCSTDGTWEVLAGLKHPKVRVHRHPQNIGAVANWNYLLAAADTEFVCFLGADDLFYPGHLARKVALLRQFPDAPFAYGPTDLVNEQGQLRAPLPFPPVLRLRRQIRRWLNCLVGVRPPASGPGLEPQRPMLAHLLRENCFIITTVVFRRAALRCCQTQFDSRLRFVIDWHLYLILLLHHPGPVRDDAVTVAYRTHGQSDTQQNNRGIAWALEVCEHLFFSLEDHEAEWTRLGFNVRTEKARLAWRLFRLALARKRAGETDAARLVWQVFQRRQGARRMAALADPRLWPSLGKRWLRVG